MLSAGLFYLTTDFVGKSLFEIVCDELGYEFVRQAQGKVKLKSGNEGAFGRVVYRVISITPISQIQSVVSKTFFPNGTDEGIDMVRYITLYLTTSEFLADYERQVENTRQITKNDWSNASALINDPNFLQRVEDMVYSKAAQLNDTVNIFMMYSRVSDLRIGLRRSIINKKRPGMKSDNRALFLSNPDLDIALENEFWKWLQTNIQLHEDRNDTIVMTKVIGSYLNSYFAPYWYKKLVAGYVTNNVETEVYGEKLSKASILTMSYLPHVDIDVYDVMDRVRNVSYSLFAHSKPGLDQRKSPLQYTLLEYYVSRILNQNVMEINSNYVDVVKSTRHMVTYNSIIRRNVPGIFQLRTDYGASRMTDADPSFVKRINANKRLVSLIDKLREDMGIKNVLDRFNSIIQYSHANSDLYSATQGSNRPYIREQDRQVIIVRDFLDNSEYADTCSVISDDGYKLITEIVRCLCDLDKLDLALRKYGLTITDMPHVRTLEKTVYSKILTVDNLVAHIYKGSSDITADTFVSHIKTDGWLVGITQREIYEELQRVKDKHYTIPQGELPKLDTSRISRKTLFEKKIPIEEVIDATAGIVDNTSKLDYVRLVSILSVFYQQDITFRTGSFNVTHAPVEGWEAYSKEFGIRLYYEVSRIFSQTKLNPFEVVSGLLYTIRNWKSGLDIIMPSIDNLSAVKYLYSQARAYMVVSKESKNHDAYLATNNLPITDIANISHLEYTSKSILYAGHQCMRNYTHKYEDFTIDIVSGDTHLQYYPLTDMNAVKVNINGSTADEDSLLAAFTSEMIVTFATLMQDAGHLAQPFIHAAYELSACIDGMVYHLAVNIFEHDKDFIAKNMVTHTEKLEFLMTYFTIYHDLSEVINSTGKGIRKTLSVCRTLMTMETKSQTFQTHMSMLLVTCAPQVDMLTNLQSTLVGLNRFTGTDELSPLINAMQGIGINPFVNTEYMGALTTQEYSAFKVSIILGIINHYTSNEMSGWLRWVAVMKEHLPFMQRLVEEEAGIKYIKAGSEGAALDTYRIYRDLLLQAKLSPDFVKRQIVVSYQSNVLQEFKKFSLNMYANEDGFLQLADGSPVMFRDTADNVIFIHKSSIGFFYNSDKSCFELQEFETYRGLDW